MKTNLTLTPSRKSLELECVPLFKVITKLPFCVCLLWFINYHH